MLRDAKVDAVVRNWFPRFLANGIDYLDLERTLAAVEGWHDWAPAWTATAERYESLARDALGAGHRVTAAEHLRRAALTLQFAQFVLTEDPAKRRALQQRQAQLYATAAPMLDPPAQRLEIPFEGGTVYGYLRVPAPTDHLPGVVVLVPGLESTKEQFSTFEPYFLRRCVATLSVEGPGQGECGFTVPFRTSTYALAMESVAARLSALVGVDPARVVVLGTSFGGYLALRYASAMPGLRGVVDIAGPYDLRDFDALQAVTQDSFREFVGASNLGQAKALLSDVSLDGVLDTFDTPVLVVHGGADRIINPANARRIVAALAGRAEVRLDPEGGHSSQNLHTVVRPFVADWVADRVGD